MTSLQLPPLTFDDGGFRMSVITRNASNDGSKSVSSNSASVTDKAPSHPPPPPPGRHAIQAVQATVVEDLDSDDPFDDLYDMSDTSHEDQDDTPEQQEPPPSNVPNHPIPSMQAAFIESLAEVTSGGVNKPKLRALDAKARRKRLLEQDADDEAFDGTWRYRNGQTQHEVAKLVSQISFGVYLLLNGMANDTTQVINILQAHIDEVDEFLEVALEDLAEAVGDLRDWMEQLQLPMANMRVFEEMLEDRTYRAEILERNQQVDHVLARTNVIMRQWDDDVDAGLVCTTSFNEWLNSIRKGPWRKERPDMGDIYNAMKGNGAGWLSAFDEMNSRAQDMNGLIIKLMTTVAELENKAGEISRKTWSTIPPFTVPVPSIGSRKNSGSAASHSVKSSSRSSAVHASIASRPDSMGRRQSDFDDDDALADFPLPGMMPLLPPVRNSARMAKKRPSEPPRTEPPRTEPPKIDSSRVEQSRTESIIIEAPRPDSPPARAASSLAERKALEGPTVGSPRPESTRSDARTAESPVVGSIDIEHRAESSGMRSPTFRLDTVMESPTLPDTASNQEDEESPMYLLQPRTYTPQLPEPVPSPRVSNPPQSPREDLFRLSEMRFPQPRNSLRERISIKAEPPRQIRIPSQVEKEHASFASPHTSMFSDHESSSSESAEALRQLYIPRVASQMDLQKQHTLMSPNSDYQHYHPVRASPHSPLQQRPHTAVDSGRGSHRPSGYFHPPGHHNQPSRMGARSTLGPAASVAGSTRSRAAPTVTPSMAGGKSVAKKKGGAFGWLKKAFTMDDDERAAFEARKNTQYQNNYYSDKSPKFLDGKRIR